MQFCDKSVMNSPTKIKYLYIAVRIDVLMAESARMIHFIPDWRLIPETMNNDGNILQ